jgi:hypothetical protein
MYLFRWILLFSLLVCAVLFFTFAMTGQEKFKRFGLTALKSTLVIAFLLFGVLIFERL